MSWDEGKEKNAAPRCDEHFAMWRGRRTHPDAVTSHAHGKCVAGWVASGDWWLHCGVCRPEFVKPTTTPPSNAEDSQ